MRIGQKITLGFVAIGVLIAGVSVSVVVSIERGLRKVETFQVPALYSIQLIQAGITEAVEESFAYVVSGERIERDEFFAWAERFDQEVEDYRRIAKLDEPGEEPEKELFGKIVAEHDGLVKKAERMFDEFEANGSVSPAAYKDYEDAVDQILSDSAQLVSFEKKEVEEAQDLAVRIIQYSQWLLYGIGILTLLVAVGVGSFISRSITNPITRLRETADEMTKGRLAGRVEIDSRDEIGRLAVSFNKMAEELQGTLETIRRQQEFESNVLGSMHESLVVVSLDGKILTVNAATCAMLGFEEQELAGQDVELISPGAAFGGPRIDELMKKGFISRLDTSYVAKGGKRIPVSLSASIMSDTHGRARGMVWVAEDMSGRRRAEQEIRLLSHAVKSVNDCIGITDLDHKTIFVNEAFEKTYGYTHDELLGRDLRLLRPGDEVEEAEDYILSETLKGGWQGELWNKRKDGKLIPIWLSTSVIRDDEGHPLALVGVSRDITAEKRAEEALRKSEASLAEAQRIAHLGNWDWDILKDELWWSDETYRIFGLKPQEFDATYEAFLESVHPDDREFVRDSVNEALYKKVPYSIDHRIVLPDGRERFVHEQAEVSLDETGGPIRMVGIVQDITARKQAEEALRKSEARFAGILDIAHEAIISIDESQHIIIFNKGAEQTFGYSAEEVIGRPLDLLLPEEFRSAHRIHVTEFAGSAVTTRPMTERREIRGRRKNGEEFPAEASISKLEVAGERILTVVLRDITDRRRAEEEIRQLNVTLEQRVAERTSQLHDAMKELEAFSYSVSHDLRSPLRAIDGFSRLLLEDCADQLDAEGKRLLNVIRTSTRSMGRLIDDLLTFSRFGRQQLVYEDINMGELARVVFDELRRMNPERIFQFSVKPLLPARGDRAMLRQVFVNLLSNAIKFTGPKPTAVIEVGGSVDERQNVYYVKDNGVGFDMRYVGKLFGVFQRLHSTHEFEGTGVGLALVQRIIHRHEGRVWAEGKVDEGATIYFALPRKEVNEDG